MRKFLPHSTPTALSHQDKTRKITNLLLYNQEQTTKKKLEKIEIYAIINQTEMSSVKIHSNETGRFPIQSISGTKYAMFIYAYDPNAIIVEPLQERIKEFILQAYQKIIGHLTNRGLQTKTTTLQQ